MCVFVDTIYIERYYYLPSHIYLIIGYPSAFVGVALGRYRQRYQWPCYTATQLVRQSLVNIYQYELLIVPGEELIRYDISLRYFIYEEFTC